MFAKVDVKGDKAHPLYTYMTEQAPGLLGMKAVKWNFTKFLIGKRRESSRAFCAADEAGRFRS